MSGYDEVQMVVVVWYFYLWSCEVGKGEMEGCKNWLVVVGVRIVRLDGDFVFFFFIMMKQLELNWFVVEILVIEKCCVGFDVDLCVWIIFDEFNSDIIGWLFYLEFELLFGCFSKVFFLFFLKEFIVCWRFFFEISCF